MHLQNELYHIHDIFRRYTQDSNSSYYHEKYYNNHHEPTPELPGWDNNTVGDDGEHAIPVHLFPKHTSELHMDQVILWILHLQGNY